MSDNCIFNEPQKTTVYVGRGKDAYLISCALHGDCFEPFIIALSKDGLSRFYECVESLNRAVEAIKEREAK